MIQIQNIRDDYPAFGDNAMFPDSSISYWLQIANLLINRDRFGQPAPFASATITKAAGGANYAVGDKVALAGGIYSQPAILSVAAVDGAGAITALTVSSLGQYTIVPGNPVASSDTTGVGAGATFTATWKSDVYTECDFAIELYACHNLVLERRANTEAANGSNPGMAQGAISGKSVGSVSINYDTAIAAVEGAGDLNLTIYGQRLAKLIKLFGMGPVTVIGSMCGGGFSAGWLTGPGAPWAGPIAQQGINWDC